jgi:hypothetical protein
VLDTTVWSRNHALGVTHASPPPTDLSSVARGGKGTSRLGLPSWSVRLGRESLRDPSATWKAG